MSWRRKEPGHQQPWYWPSYTELTRSPHVKGYKYGTKHSKDDLLNYIAKGFFLAYVHLMQYNT